MYFNIFVIYHTDIYRKKLIDNIINKLFYKPNIEYIYSHLHTKKTIDIDKYTDINLSINDIATILDHKYIWNIIASDKKYHNNINLIIDDTVTMNSHKYDIFTTLQIIDHIIDDLHNNITCLDWNILYLYNQQYTKLFNEIHITNNILIPSHKRTSYKAYFITYNSAKILLSIDIKTSINDLFVSLQYNSSSYNLKCWYAFATTKNIFIDDHKNEDITQFIKYYSPIKSPYSIDINFIGSNTITKYFTIICLVDKYKEYHYFKLICNLINSFGYHIVPIFYDSHDDKSKLIIKEFQNLHTYDIYNHYIITTSIIYLIINIDFHRLSIFYDKLNCNFVYSHKIIYANKLNFIDTLWENHICITKYIHIHNHIYNNYLDYNSAIYNKCKYGDDIFFSIENDARLIKLKYDNETNFFYYKDTNNNDIFPLFIYSIKHNILIDDILNIYPYRGKLIDFINNKNYKFNKLLIMIYIDDDIYSNIGNNINTWLSNYKDKLIIQNFITDIDFILYTIDDAIYDKVTNKYKIEINFTKDIREYFISILQYAENTYEYIFITTGYHQIKHIYTIYDLIYSNMSIISPLITGNKNNKKTLSIYGTINKIINRDELGIWMVPYIKDTILLKNNVYSDIILSMINNNLKNGEQFEDYFIRCIKLCNIPIWCSNIREYGVDIRI
jgi:hypothetical protein